MENEKEIIKDDKAKAVPQIDNKKQIDAVDPKVDAEYKVNINTDHGMGVDIFKIPEPDAKYEYRWLNSKTEGFGQKTGNMLHFGGGWQVCAKEHILKIGFKEADIASDGLMRLNELVLAFMPKELYAEKLKVKAEKANSPVDAIKRMVTQGDPNADGARPHQSMKGIQTKEQLNGNWK